MDKNRLFERASEAFMKKDFKKAQELFTDLLRHDPDNLQGKMGIMLCDLLSESEEEAIALFDYYEVLVEEGEQEPEKVIIEMIKNFDKIENEINELALPLLTQISEEGISYADFKAFVKERGDFKKAYEDIMFSTKVIITKKEDLFDFVNTLIEHGYKEQAYTYIEDASKLYPLDRELVKIFKKLKHDL